MDPLRTDDGCDLESSILEDERRESRPMVGAAHLQDSDPPLDLDVRDRVHLELENPVREERLVPPGLRRLEPEERGVGRRLREDEGRPAEVPQPLEEPEQFRSPVLELREDLERLERVRSEERRVGKEGRGRWAS